MKRFIPITKIISKIDFNNNHNQSVKKSMYEGYRLSKKESICLALACIVVDLLLSYLFFNSFYVSVLLIPVLILWGNCIKEDLLRKRIMKLNIAFKDGMSAVVSALQTGYSVENAFESAWRELRVLYGTESDIALEFKRIANSSQINKSIDGMLQDFGERSGNADIKSFAEVFTVARKSGSGLVETVTNTINIIGSRIQMKSEINNAISAKRYEFYIMMIVPICILFYLRVTAYSFIDNLYNTFTGRITMIGCVLVYIVSFVIGNKICDIEVK